MFNHPENWIKFLHQDNQLTNKYDKGNLLVVGGGINCTGAARLSAISAIRMGSGLVSVACDRESLRIYASSLMSVMTKPYDTLHEFSELISDPKYDSLLIGPGLGVNDDSLEQAIYSLKTLKPIILDADIFKIFENIREDFYNLVHSNAIMTPHLGEFKRVFDYTGNIEEDALNAAKISGSIIVLKGPRSIICDYTGRIVINEKPNNLLSTAGTGDVLAGIIAGLIAQHIPLFEAACIGVWFHSRIGDIMTRGMISEDLPKFIPQIFEELGL